MKRFLCLFFAVSFILLCSFSCADELESHNTEHFSYAIPKGWHKEVSDNSFYHFEDIASISQCGYIGVTEQMTDSGITSGTEGADIFFDVLIDMASGDQGADSMIAKFEINGYPAAIVQNNVDGENAVFVFLFAEQYLFTQLFKDSEESAESLFEMAKALSGSIHFIDAPGEAVFNANYGEDAEMHIDSIASAVFEDTLITSRAGKYPTVSFKAVKNDILGTITEENDVLVFADGKILLFLEKFQKFCRSQPYYFEDLRFNIYTTFFDESTMDTTAGLVLAFNISYDTVLNQNFKNATLDDLFDSGFNKYVHPFLQ